MRGVLRKIKKGNGFTWKIIKCQNYWINEDIKYDLELPLHPDSVDKVNQKDHEFKFFYYDVVDGKAKLKL
jgi:hypothetical protein